MVCVVCGNDIFPEQGSQQCTLCLAFIHDECDKQQPAAAAYNYFDCRQKKEEELVGATNNTFDKMKQKSIEVDRHTTLLGTPRLMQIYIMEMLSMEEN